MKKSQTATLLGSLVAGAMASACCIGPLILTVLGISGAAAAQRFEPFRPFLLVTTFGLLVGAFYLSYRNPKDACATDGACDTNTPSRLGRIALWLTTVIVILSASFPWYASFLF